MVTLDALNSAAPDDFARALDGVFEHAPWVPQHAAALRPFATVEEFHQSLMNVVRQADAGTQRRFLGGHPPLSSAAIAANLTADSTAEQVALGLAGLGDAAGRFAELSAAYEARHGFPFIICARRHTPRSVLAQLEQRIGHDEAQERAAALDEVFFISRLRLVSRVSGPGVPRTSGTLSAAVVAEDGTPAAGVPVELWRDGAKLHAAATGLDGSVALLQGEPLRIGPHELRFHVGGAFGAVPVRWWLAEPEGDIRVRLVLAPDGYRVSL